MYPGNILHTTYYAESNKHIMTLWADVNRNWCRNNVGLRAQKSRVASPPTECNHCICHLEIDCMLTCSVFYSQAKVTPFARRSAGQCNDLTVRSAVSCRPTHTFYPLFPSHLVAINNRELNSDIYRIENQWQKKEQ